MLTYFAAKMLKYAATMVCVQFCFAVINILYKQVLNGGMHHVVLVAYRQMVSVVILIPLAYYVERYVCTSLRSPLGGLIPDWFDIAHISLIWCEMCSFACHEVYLNLVVYEIPSLIRCLRNSFKCACYPTYVSSLRIMIAGIAGRSSQQSWFVKYFFVDFSGTRLFLYFRNV